MLNLNIFFGPPSDRTKDKEAVQSFLNRDGCKIICGGTAFRIFRRETGLQAAPDLKTYNDGIPPFCRCNEELIIMEGRITFKKVFEIFKIKYTADNAATLLKNEITTADRIFLYTSERSPVNRKRWQILEEFIGLVKSSGKEIELFVC